MALSNFINSQGSFVAKTSPTGSGALPAGTTGERDGSATAGYMRFNSTTSGFEGYDGSAWGEIGGGGASGASGEGILYENEKQIDNSYSITSGYNGVSAGPITLASGATVTVTSGCTWVIV
jgi:hypothetical protein